jgi:hypothetical protein
LDCRKSPAHRAGLFAFAGNGLKKGNLYPTPGAFKTLPAYSPRRMFQRQASPRQRRIACHK